MRALNGRVTPVQGRVSRPGWLCSCQHPGPQCHEGRSPGPVGSWWWSPPQQSVGLPTHRTGSLCCWAPPSPAHCTTSSHAMRLWGSTQGADGAPVTHMAQSVMNSQCLAYRENALKQDDSSLGTEFRGSGRRKEEKALNVKMNGVKTLAC